MYAFMAKNAIAPSIELQSALFNHFKYGTMFTGSSDIRSTVLLLTDNTNESVQTPMIRPSSE